MKRYLLLFFVISAIFSLTAGKAFAYVATMTINVYEDNNGKPGNKITETYPDGADGVAGLQVGKSYWFEVMARDLHPLTSGFNMIYIDVNWTPGSISNINIWGGFKNIGTDVGFSEVSDDSVYMVRHLNCYRGGSLNTGENKINYIGGAVLNAICGGGRAIGNLYQERFLLLKFRAEKAGTSTLTMTPRILTLQAESSVNVYSQTFFEKQTLVTEPQYEFKTNLYKDDGGKQGALITTDSVESGQQFFMEITARDTRPQPQGLRSMGMRISWDPSVFEEIDNPFNPKDTNQANRIVTYNFPLYKDGQLNNAIGQIDWLSGASEISTGAGRPISRDGKPEYFSILRLKAKKSAQNSPINMEVRGGVGFIPMRDYARDDISFENQKITVTAQGTACSPSCSGATPKCYFKVCYECYDNTDCANNQTNHPGETKCWRKFSSWGMGICKQCAVTSDCPSGQTCNLITGQCANEIKKLVAYYPFDTNTNDNSGNGNNGVAYGAVLTAGNKGQAYGFDGVNDYIDSADIDLNQGTIALWIKPSLIPNVNSGLVSKRGANDSDLPFSVGMVAGTTKVRALVDDGSVKYIDSSSQIGAGNWGYVVATMSNNIMKIYLNGKFENSIVVGNPKINNFKYKIGAYGNGNSAIYYFNGSIDEVKVWNYELNEAEILNEYISSCPAKICSQLGKQCGNWDNGCGTQINCGTCPSGQTCNTSTGTCSSASVCTDSDVTTTYSDGKNFYQKGTTCRSSYCRTDYCDTTNNKDLTEYFCESGQITATTIRCTSCSDGKCLSISQTDNENVIAGLTGIIEYLKQLVSSLQRAVSF